MDKFRAFMIALWLLALLFLGSCSGLTTQKDSKDTTANSPGAIPQNQEAVDVYILQLIATPENYDGRVVRFIGFARVEFEHLAIYHHQDDDKYAIPRSGLWLDMTSEEFDKYRHYDGKYVLVEGIFSSQDKGHKGGFSGAVRNFRRFEAWADISGFRR
jgi:hypothetical protein